MFFDPRRGENTNVSVFQSFLDSIFIIYLKTMGLTEYDFNLRNIIKINTELDNPEMQKELQNIYETKLKSFIDKVIADIKQIWNKAEEESKKNPPNIVKEFVPGAGHLSRGLDNVENASKNATKTIKLTNEVVANTSQLIKGGAQKQKQSKYTNLSLSKAFLDSFILMYLKAAGIPIDDFNLEHVKEVNKKLEKPENKAIIEQLYQTKFKKLFEKATLDIHKEYTKTKHDIQQTFVRLIWGLIPGLGQLFLDIDNFVSLGSKFTKGVDDSSKVLQNTVQNMNNQVANLQQVTKLPQVQVPQVQVPQVQVPQVQVPQVPPVVITGGGFLSFTLNRTKKRKRKLKIKVKKIGGQSKRLVPFDILFSQAQQRLL